MAITSGTSGGSINCSYNGVQFGTFIRSKVTATPIYDEAKRMVKYVRHELEIKATIALGLDKNGRPIDTNAELNRLRRALTAPRKELHYDQQGYGTLVVNRANGPWDVASGPTPELLAYTTVGGGYAAVVDWKVTVCIPECQGAAFLNKLMAACWEVDYAIGRDGLTTITTTGHIEIPLNQGRDFLVDSADRWRESLASDPPLGFQRTQQDFKLSMDRSRLNFTIIDTEVPSALPDDVVEIDIKHTVSNDSATVVNGGTWTSRISGSIKMQPKVPRSYAWDTFVAITSSRVLHTINNRFSAGPDAPPQRLTVLPVKYEITEDVFGLSTNFSLSYKIFRGYLEDIISAAALWQPVGTDWRTWRTSLRDNAAHIRGVARVAYRTNDDTFLDLCSSRPPRAPSAGTGRAPPAVPPVAANSPDATHAMTGAGRSAPPSSVAYDGTQEISNAGDDIPFEPEASWYHWDADLFLDEDDHIVRHKPLAGKVTVRPPTVDPASLKQVAGRKGVDSASIVTDTPDILQRLHSPTQRVWLIGEALRVGYPVDVPRLLTYRGQPAVQARQLISTNKVVGNLGGWVIYMRTWKILYEIPQAGTGKPGMPILANPLTGTDGTAA